MQPQDIAIILAVPNRSEQDVALLQDKNKSKSGSQSSLLSPIPTFAATMVQFSPSNKLADRTTSAEYSSCSTCWNCVCICVVLKSHQLQHALKYAFILPQGTKGVEPVFCTRVHHLYFGEKRILEPKTCSYLSSICSGSSVTACSIAAATTPMAPF